MSPARVFRQRLLMCLGLAMIIAGVTAASIGYLAATDAKSRTALVVTPQPTTKKATATATTRKTTIAKSKRTTTAAKSAAAKRRAAAAAAATTRTSAAVLTVDANANPTVSRQYRQMMAWGGAMLVVGLASVGYSIHERKPKAPTTGSDELLNDAPPF